MPVKNYGKLAEAKLEEYKKLYDVEDNPNDLASIRAMVSLELSLEKMQKALLSTDALKFPKKVKDLQGAIRDGANSFAQLQTELGISRRKRQAEDDKISVVDYIDQLKKEAKNLVDRRLKKITCSKCGQVLGKYYIYIEDSNPAEAGSISLQKSPPQPMRYGISVQCWKCWGLEKKISYGKASWK